MPVVWSVQINRGNAQAVAFQFATRLVTDTTRRTFNRANILTPVDTGRLRAGNQFHVRREANRVVGEVFNNTAYARAVHDGSKARTIRPRRRKALRFVIGGQVVFARSVRMPARRGRPWIARALKEIAGPQGYTVRGV